MDIEKVLHKLYEVLTIYKSFGKMVKGKMRNRKSRLFYRAKYFTEIKANNFPDGSQDKSTAKQIDLMVLNLSIDGVGALTREEVKNGSIFTFTLFLGGIGHELMAYSTFCIKIGDLFRIGLKIISPDNIYTNMLLDYIKQEKLIEY